MFFSREGSLLVLDSDVPKFGRSFVFKAISRELITDQPFLKAFFKEKCM